MKKYFTSAPIITLDDPETEALYRTDDFHMLYKASDVHTLLERVLPRLEDVLKFCETGDFNDLHRNTIVNERLVDDLKKILEKPDAT